MRSDGSLPLNQQESSPLSTQGQTAQRRRNIPSSRTLSRGVIFLAVVAYAAVASWRQFHRQPLPQHADLIEPVVRLAAADARDQDDMCVWVHPTARSRSTVIASDKSADRLFVYDLRGRVLQKIPATKPGNIDLRRGFLLAGRPVDLVVVNQREGGKELLAFTVDPHRGTLTRVDDGNIHLRFNYGGCLYRDVATAQLYFFVTTKGYGVAQYELVDNGLGKVTGRLVRNWPMQQCEAAVADDDSATLFVAEEAAGVWKFGANPDAPLPGELIIKIGSHGLRGDVEGLALLKQADGRSWLIVSDQGRNRFMVFDCSQENAFLGEFAVAGAVQSDGIEVVPGCLGPDFPEGIFACHTNSDGRPVLLSPLDRIERELYD